MNPFITHMFQRAPIATDADGNIYCIRTGAILIPANADLDDSQTALSLANQIIAISQRLADSATPAQAADSGDDNLNFQYQQIDNEIANLAAQPVQPPEPPLTPINDICPPLSEFSSLQTRDRYLDIFGLKPMPLQQRYFPSPPKSIYNPRWWLKDESDPMMPGSRPKRSIDYDIEPELLAHINAQFTPQPNRLDLWFEQTDQRINKFLGKFKCLNFLGRWSAHLDNWWNRCEAKMQNRLGNPMAVPPPINDSSPYSLHTSSNQHHLQLQANSDLPRFQLPASHH